MEKNSIVKFLVVAGVALLLPQLFKLPNNLFDGNIFFLFISCGTYEVVVFFAAKEEYRKYIACFPALMIIAVILSYIPWKPTSEQVSIYYKSVIAALAISLASHMLGWILSPSKKDKSNDKNTTK